MNKRILKMAGWAGVVVLLLAGQGGAATATWVGGYAGGDWLNATNWNPIGVPNSGYDYEVTNVVAGSAGTCSVVSGTAFLGNSLTIKNGGVLWVKASSSIISGSPTNMILADGIIRCTGNYSLNISNLLYLAAGSTNVVQANGDFTMGAWQNYVGLTGSGVLRKKGPNQLAIWTPAQGLYNGTIEIDEGTWLQLGSTAFSNATISVNEGATNKPNNSTTYKVGLLKLNGGTLLQMSTLGSAHWSGPVQVARRSVASPTAAYNTIGYAWTLSGSSNLSFVAVPGGFTMQAWANTGNGYTGTWIMGAGVTNDLNRFSVTLGGLSSSLAGGCMVTNTYNQACTLTLQPPAGVTNDYSGGIGGSQVSLVMTNAGVQRLRGACAYPGTTMVAGGTLLVDGSLLAGGGTVTVKTGGTLGGTGLIDRAVVVTNGAVLSPGDGGAGMLTVSNLTMYGGVTNLFDIGFGGVNDQVQVKGNMTVSGVVQARLGPGVDEGRYPLFTCMGVATTTNLVLAPLQGVNAILEADAQNVYLKVKGGGNVVLLK